MKWVLGSHWQHVFVSMCLIIYFYFREGVTSSGPRCWTGGDGGMGYRGM